MRGINKADPIPLYTYTNKLSFSNVLKCITMRQNYINKLSMKLDIKAPSAKVNIFLISPITRPPKKRH